MGLATISIEKQIDDDLDTKDFIEDFASLKAQRVNFKLELLMFLLDFSIIHFYSFKRCNFFSFKSSAT